MGNICGKDIPSHVSSTASERPTDKTGSHAFSENDEVPDVLSMVEKMKEYHRARLRNELEKDPQAFILDNLLLCIQFFDSFDRAVFASNEFKRSVEREMTELLAKDPQEGMILGDRRIKLLSGMSHLLSQNYIYRGKNHADDESEIDSYYGGAGLKDTFLNEGILPLEFLMSWDNFEVYEPNEIEGIKDYSDAKGASPIARFCMEQPSKRTEYPEGYVRLKCVDEPIFHRKPQARPPAENCSDNDYSNAPEPVYSKPYSDGVPEALSESDGTAPNSEDTTSDDDDLMKMTEKLKSLPSVWKPFSSAERQFSHSPKPGTSKSLTKLQVSQIPTDKNEPFPSVFVHAPTPPVFEGQTEMLPFEDGFLSPVGLRHSHRRMSPDFNQPSIRYSPGKETPSSGYETISTVSQTSSMASSMMRERWQKKNVNNLWEFPKKSRKEQIPVGAKYDPIPSDCYTEVKLEISYDAPEEDDEDDDLDSEDESEEDASDEEEFNNNNGSKPGRRRRDTEEMSERFYLNSLQFSSNACSEFHHIGPIIRIPTGSLFNGVVLGTTIRCPIPYTYPRDTEDEDLSTVGNYYVTYTFTPALHSKAWPTGMYFYFNQQMFNRKVHGKMWPSREQIEQIELYGCNAIPLGYRSVGFFNAEQILEWELNFHECEINLLDSFRSPHWRAYIFSSILFRAFIAPLGPQGLGLEHIRNILYCMCYKDFYGWNIEQPGVHLNILLDNLFDSLSKGYMGSFFVRSKNLLQSIPQRNLRFVQGHLKRIRENLIIYCIYAFRNLVNIRKTENSFPFPNFKRLYEILTWQDADLLKIVNSSLMRQQDREDAEMQEKFRKEVRKSKKKNKPKPTNLLEREDEIEKSFKASQRELLNKPQIQDDKHRRKLLRAHQRWVEKQQEQLKKNREEQRLNQDPEVRLPDAEKRHSIDLKKTPVDNNLRFNSLRILLVIQFFVQHFLEMAKKATTMHNYSVATMYVLQIENLCEICQEEQYSNVASPFTEEEFELYRRETLRLRAIMGKDMEQYILDKIASSSSQRVPPTPAQFLNEPTIESMEFPTFTNNWDLRKLPTPPPVKKEMGAPVKKLEMPNIVSSLQSFEDFSDAMNPPAAPATIVAPSPRNPPRRQESIKFISSMSPRDTPPPATPPRSSRLASRQSTMSISLDREIEDVESTDL